MDRTTSVLVTGGTGSFGQAFARRLLSVHPDIRRLVIFSRDELKQFQMAQQFSEREYPGLRYFIGDVRDADRLRQAFEDIDVVVHAAGLKQGPAAEYNPFEFIKTNILGANNVIEAAIAQDVRRVVALSTDKAAAPINVYGATKLCSDKLFIAANNHKGRRDIRFSVVRYGNVLGSRGSVVPFFLEQRESGRLPITDPRMTRFSITIDHAVNLVLRAIEQLRGGEILVPKIPSYRITDLAEAIGPDCEHLVIGTRPSEKIHEEMITQSDAAFTVDIGDCYAILPATSEYTIDQYCVEFGCSAVAPDFSYNSGDNPHFLTVAQVRALIDEYTP